MNNLLSILSIQDNALAFPLITGVLAAMLHVLSGPDHLAAVAPLTVEKRKKTWKIGMFWGFGHLFGMLLIGILFTLFRNYIPIERISEHSEQLVGFVLIAIGIWSFYKIKSSPNKTHQHPHIHHDEEILIHIHKHQHKHDTTHVHTHAKHTKSDGNWAAFSVGSLHGLAGVSHFLLFLPTLAFESNFDSILYIIGFAIGTVLSMTLFSIVLGEIAQRASLNHKDRLFTGIRFGAGIFAMGIGTYWILSNL
jgi:ABC-type nickel/cobalt efflux system permease component RcnA